MNTPGTSNFHPIPCKNFYGVYTEAELGGDETDLGSNVDPEEEIRDDGEKDTDIEQSDDENGDDPASDLLLKTTFHCSIEDLITAKTKLSGRRQSQHSQFGRDVKIWLHIYQVPKALLDKLIRH
ncbi:unnamed protein product [Acanthoscelides obtectus]|uniref:Uncharacterized protein n=1 Tax=Acanthoscelides obtectus TaxID=200917 RepID=A0A9P0PL59_ACAOB|nr:unnamed protein product [Acanthoscelides obtectus]CAK1620437.1 hypothetical protein AOBTE_LOCUS374 [Acanthoscelides obtectus]